MYSICIFCAFLLCNSWLIFIKCVLDPCDVIGVPPLHPCGHLRPLHQEIMLIVSRFACVSRKLFVLGKAMPFNCCLLLSVKSGQASWK